MHHHEAGPGIPHHIDCGGGGERWRGLAEATDHRRLRSGETIEFVRVERSNYQYLYRDGDAYVFMDPNTYEQHFVDS
ncbi:MAG: hypothetical protein KBH14_15445, partial [Vicinamibacteria bacterium]|nr:hypothetical protein [Vicinamibacteria bacterium]